MSKPKNDLDRCRRKPTKGGNGNLEVLCCWELGESPKILPKGPRTGSLGQNNMEAEGKSNGGFS